MSGPVGGVPERKHVVITVTSRSDEDLASFIQLCKTIEWMGRVGTSREIRVPVDGDGAADLRFDFGETDAEGVKPAINDDNDDGEGCVIGIGG